MGRGSKSARAIEKAMSLHRSGRLADAEVLYLRILKTEPQQFDALHLLGLLRHQQGRRAEALDLIAAALGANPSSLPALANYGMVLHQLGRHQEALASTHKALALAPDNPDVLMNYGATLAALARHDEALACFDKVLAQNPRDAEARYNRGLAIAQLGRHNEAVENYDQFLALNPRDAEALNSRGIALHELHRHNAAVASFDAALALKPNYADVHYNKANTLIELKRPLDALASYNKAIAAKPHYADALADRGSLLAELQRYSEASASFQQALALAPDHSYAFRGLTTLALATCDWEQTTKYAEKMPARILDRKCDVDPLRLLQYSDDQSLQLECARNHFHAIMPNLPKPMWQGTMFRHDRMRIAYLSADFRPHATMSLMAAMFERHDWGRFETFGISYGPDDNSPVRARAVGAFNHFHQVRSKSDYDVAKLLHDLEIDIAVDLKGYTRDGRPSILAHRPCPIQVSYMGFPATMGVDFIDYIIADEIVLPFDQQAYFTEKIVHLPDSYWVTSYERDIAPETPTRQSFGLPESGFVFCCFNNSFKITAPVFDVWMRLLQRVDGSVLWLLGDNAAARENLCKQAVARGVDPATLVFAERMLLPQHLSRHRLADLFLDTLPYNAHTTASDALWAGLPVLTCRGRTFVGRVAASLDHAVGLDDLVTNSLAEYEVLALRLAYDASLLCTYRDTLQKNRLTCPLFDTSHFCRRIEAAYCQMWQRWQRGDAPRAFAIEPL